MNSLLIKSDFEIIETETGKYILQTPYKSYYIPIIFYDIIKLLKLGHTVDEIADIMGETTNITEINEIIKKSFVNMGIIQGYPYDQKKKGKMLFLRKDIVAPSFLYNKHILSFIYNKYFACISLAVYLYIYIYGFIYWNGIEILKDFTFSFDQGIAAGIYLVILYISSIVHELGHYLTCIWLGGKPGKIGIGIYIMTPVLYVSLDDLWRLLPKKRYLVNIAGVYFQTLFLLIFAAIAFIMQLKIPFVICFIGSLSTLLNFIPFLKYDGYWIITDYLETDSLMDKSIEYLLSIIRIKNKKNRYESKSSVKKMVFKIYSIALGGFLLLFTYFFVMMFWNNIIVLYELAFYRQFTTNILWVILRSIFIIAVSIKVISILSMRLRKK